ncbi:MAG TPA: N-methyl-L-tryptophan oxidase [Actinomycetota bacterium]|jgi:sarcosine oxidase
MRCDVAVVGAGVMGSSTAYALARKGLDVVVLEQFAVGHNRGSSHGAARIFRLSYPDATYVEMAQESLSLWRDLERDSEADLLARTGGLDTGKNLDEHAAALSACGAAFELIDGAETRARWPFMAVPPAAPVLFQPDAGVVSAEAAWRALSRGARAAGARMHDGARVARLEPEDREVFIRTSTEEIRARAVVVTAGAWARALLATAGIELDTRPTRETVAYFRLNDLVPPTLVDWGAPSVYALPSPGGEIKAGEHRAGPTIDPDVPGEVDPEAVARVRAWVLERLPGADPVPRGAETCLYTNTPDERFVLERHGRIVVGSPCSGHGFKFAPLIGRRLAGLAGEALEA